jgi:NADH dehydrogenase FAD-containing subunit
VYRPLAVAEPFCLGHAARHPLAEIVRDFGAGVVRRALTAVDPAQRVVTTSDGSTLAYDSLLIAVGAPGRPVHRHAITFGADGAPEAWPDSWPTSRTVTPTASRSSSRAASRGACRSTSSRS